MLPTAACEREHVADALGAYLAAEHGQLVRLLSNSGAAANPAAAGVRPKTAS